MTQYLVQLTTSNGELLHEAIVKAKNAMEVFQKYSHINLDLNKVHRMLDFQVFKSNGESAIIKAINVQEFERAIVLDNTFNTGFTFKVRQDKAKFDIKVKDGVILISNYRPDFYVDLVANPKSGTMQHLFETYLIDTFRVNEGLLAIHGSGSHYLNSHVNFLYNAFII